MWGLDFSIFFISVIYCLNELKMWQLWVIVITTQIYKGIRSRNYYLLLGFKSSTVK